ncbi:MAG: hypothetical protein HYU02_05635, partial [Thaumarchaeota archaeon]|nr:hypothetical protein [Nitrososphaerota archaeon]
MQKRAQVTVFIILGLVVMVVAGLFLLNNQGKGLPSRLASENDLAAVNTEGLAIQGLVNSCLKQKFLQGKGYFGLEKSSTTELERYIETTMPECAGIYGYDKKGLKVQAEEPRAKVTITEQASVADLYYPITVSSGDAKAELQSFSYYFKLESRVTLKQGSDGRT